MTQADTPNERRFSGQSCLVNYALPRLFFHVTTAHAIVRHNGVELGEKGSIGTY